MYATAHIHTRNTLQHAATRCNTMQHNATPCCGTHTHLCMPLRTYALAIHTATPCNTVQHGATRCNTVQHAATHCRSTHTHPCMLPHICTLAIHSHHAATRCNTLQHPIAAHIHPCVCTYTNIPLRLWTAFVKPSPHRT